VDAPGGGGKIPVMPDYLISQSDHKVVLRNYEGFITSYEEPISYQAHNSETCPYCLSKRVEPGQSGVSGLLEGESLSIKPEGFDGLHGRGGGKHRLRADDNKWKALGIGSDEPQE
jgi:lysine 2,3-aminomutase